MNRLNLVIVLCSFTIISYLNGCSDDSPVNNNTIPPAPVDTSEFMSMRDLLPQWTLTQNLRQIKVINEKMWITTWEPFMYYSQDSGKTFSKIGLINVLPLISMYPDGINGWSGGENLLKTSNSGLNWTYSSVSINVRDIYFANMQTGYFLASNYGIQFIRKTINGGDNWTDIPVIISAQTTLNFTSLCIPDSISSTRIFIGTDHGLYKSTNNGNGWSLVNFAPGIPYISKIFFQSRNHFWVCGNNGFLASYSFGGTEVWKVMQLNNGADNLTSIHFAKDGLNGWITTDKSFVFHTTDGGNTWNIKYYGQNYASKLNDVYTVSDKEAYFVGSGSMFYKYTKK